MSKGDKNQKDKAKKSYWTLKITVITFALSLLISFITEITTKDSSIIIAFILLVLLIFISIIADAVAVAVTACDKAPLASMAARRIKGSRIALKLQSNADKVANICADVIGDICGIVSGACAIVIVYKILTMDPSANSLVLTIVFSSVIAALTVGGKAVMKTVSIKKSKDIVMAVAKFLDVFISEEKL